MAPNRTNRTGLGAAGLSTTSAFGAPLATLIALTLSLGLLALAGCGDDDDNGVAPGASAELRVIHLSPTAPAVNVFLNQGTPAAVTGLAFPDGTGYLSVPAGTYRVDVAAGATPTPAALTVPGLTLEAGKRYTAVAFDNLAAIKALPLEDDFAGIPAGSIRVRAVHAAPGVGQVDIWNVPAMGAPAPLYTNVDFGVAGGYIDIPAGSYTLGFDVDDDAAPDLTFTTPSLPAGTKANLFAVNDAPGNVFLIAQLNDGTIARIDPN